MKPLMKCGHAGNATNNKTGKPCCVICIGLTPDAEVETDSPNLSNRTAQCAYGPHAPVPSALTLAFFEHRPNEQFDTYYCGCHGWD